MRSWLKVALTLLAATPVTPAVGQLASGAASQEMGGAVTGRVVCSDTQRPARFATVELVRKLTAQEQKPPAPGNRTNDRQVAAQLQAAGASRFQNTVMAQTRTGLDGSFTLDDIQPGDYYAVGALPGYILPIAAVPEIGGPPGDSNAQDMNAPMVNFPLVHVAAGRTSSVDLTLDRGGVLGGRVTFDDGSPVAAATVRLTLPDGKDALRDGRMTFLVNSAIGLPRGFAETDDDGRYRVAGLPPGKYIVQATVTVENNQRMKGDAFSSQGLPGSTQTLTIFSPHGFRQSEAAVLEVRGSEARTDADIQVDLNGLHSLRGRIVASDHGPIGNVFVELSDQGDRTFHRGTSVAADGSFHFDYLAPGNYALETVVMGMAYAGPTALAAAAFESFRTVRQYTPVKTTAVVGERDVVLDDLLVTPVKAGNRTDEGDPAGKPE